MYGNKPGTTFFCSELNFVSFCKTAATSLVTGLHTTAGSGGSTAGTGSGSSRHFLENTRTFDALGYIVGKKRLVLMNNTTRKGRSKRPIRIRASCLGTRGTRGGSSGLPDCSSSAARRSARTASSPHKPVLFSTAKYHSSRSHPSGLSDVYKAESCMNE